MIWVSFTSLRWHLAGCWLCAWSVVWFGVIDACDVVSVEVVEQGIVDAYTGLVAKVLGFTSLAGISFPVSSDGGLGGKRCS